VKLSFHGAAQTVTGSCHLLEFGGTRILVDCGLFQGGREIDEENAADFGFDPASIDIVLLTHAHLDHCGRLPLLSRRGFRGEVVATAATFDLARLVLVDSANLHLEEVRRRQRHGSRDGGALYSMVDTLDAIGRFGRAASYGRPIELAAGITATFLDAGHIAGSASILIDVRNSGRARSVLFSGDLGNAGRPLMRVPRPPAHADIVVMETTYGDRQHRAYEATVAEFLEAIDATLVRGGNVIIPTFALERAQEVLFVLHKAVMNRRFPRSLPVFLDSPMAMSATEIYRKHPECFPEAVAREIATNDPFSVPALSTTPETADSRALNRITGGALILAGSGMCTGGRIRHHLRHNLSNRDCGVIFVGFAAHGTMARQIIDGAKSVRIFGEEVAVRARIHTINGFSAHADQAELLAWHRQIRDVGQTFLVHGEAEVMNSFAKSLGAPCLQPALHQSYSL
jgi:metallo-beta-lactamase family protein